MQMEAVEIGVGFRVCGAKRGISQPPPSTTHPPRQRTVRLTFRRKCGSQKSKKKSFHYSGRIKQAL